MCKTVMIGAMKPVSLLFDQPTYIVKLGFTVVSIILSSFASNYVLRVLGSTAPKGFHTFEQK